MLAHLKLAEDARLVQVVIPSKKDVEKVRCVRA